MSKELVFVENNQVVATSRKVAEYFEKAHKNVIADIRQILVAENSAAKFFFKSTYENRGKQYIQYLMNRDGFSLLAMGFTGNKAMQFKLKYIEAFNAMEAKLKSQVSKIDPTSVLDPDVIIALATQLKEARKENKQLTKENEIMQPKAKYYDDVLNSSSLIPITRIAKEYGLSGQSLNRLLCKWEIQYKQGGVFVLYQDYANEGYAYYEDYPYIDDNGDAQTSQLLKWTQKGREFLHYVLTSNGYNRRKDLRNI